MRKITVVSTDTQKKVTFDTEATTVEELLGELDAHEIAWEGKTLFEGISHSAIETSIPEGVLPHDNQYRGTVTNDLVILVTAGKKISSGMDRAAVYAKIKELGVQDAVREHFGKHYTNVSTEDLVNFLNSSQPEGPEEGCQDGCPLEMLMLAFLHTAILEGLISPDHVMFVLRETGYTGACQDDGKSPFSNEEIADMFKNIRIE